MDHECFLRNEYFSTVVGGLAGAHGAVYGTDKVNGCGKDSDSIPENNVATARLPQSFPIKGDFRVGTNQREAFDKKRESMRPQVGSCKCNMTAQVRLHIDEIAARVMEIFLVGPIPMRPTRLLRVTQEHAEGHFKAKETIWKNINKKWQDELYPPYYDYRPPYRDCWNFMTLPKFAAGRIH